MNYRDERDREIFVDTHDQNIYQLPERMVGWKVIDAGAHIGSTAILMAEKGAIVHAYEPNKENYKLLKENTKGYKIKCYREAIGKEGKRTLYHHKDHASHSLKKIKNTGSEEVRVVSLKTAYRRLGRCDLLKLDCEGCEFEIINEIQKLPIARLVGEVHCSPGKVVEKFCDKLPYSFKRINDNVYTS